MEWYLKVLKENYANFDGRARRSEYWYFMLFNVIISIVLNILAGVFGSISGTLAMIVSGIAGLYSLAVLVPGIAVGVRRLHDTGKSGWLMLLGLVPIANFYLIYLLAIEGTPGDNEFGSNPKMIG